MLTIEKVITQGDEGDFFYVVEQGMSFSLLTVHMLGKRAMRPFFSGRLGHAFGPLF